MVTGALCIPLFKFAVPLIPVWGPVISKAEELGSSPCDGSKIETGTNTRGRSLALGLGLGVVGIVLFMALTLRGLHRQNGGATLVENDRTG
jgi:hypothetical protein